MLDKRLSAETTPFTRWLSTDSRKRRLVTGRDLKRPLAAQAYPVDTAALSDRNQLEKPRQT